MNPRTALQERYPAADLFEYFRFLGECRGTAPEGTTHDHHICPRKQFPEFIDSPENLITLSVDDHKHAHALLAAAVPELWRSANWFNQTPEQHSDPSQQQEIMGGKERSHCRNDSHERNQKMKINYLPPSPLAGQTAHLPPERAQALVDAGFAVAVPYKNYQERLADTMPKSVAPLVQWAVNEKAAGGAVIVKTVNVGDVSYYSAPPSDAPQAVVDRFNYLCRLSTEYGASKAETERLEREQHSLKEKVAAGIGKILYGRGGK